MVKNKSCDMHTRHWWKIWISTPFFKIFYERPGLTQSKFKMWVILNTDHCHKNPAPQPLQLFCCYFLISDFIMGSFHDRVLNEKMIKALEGMVHVTNMEEGEGNFVTLIDEEKAR